MAVISKTDHRRPGNLATHSAWHLHLRRQPLLDQSSHRRSLTLHLRQSHGCRSHRRRSEFGEVGEVDKAAITATSERLQTGELNPHCLLGLR